MGTGRRLAWRTSTRSSNGEACVEVAPAAEGVVIRHSKRPGDGTITFTHTAWSRFLRESLGELTPANGVVTTHRIGADTLVCSLRGEVELRFDDEEWAAFRAGAAAGEFDFVAEPAAAH